MAREPRRFWRAGRATTALLAAVPLIAAGWVWFPIRGNYFRGDDFVNLFFICNRPLAEYLLTPHAGHVQPVRNGVFYAFARLFGTDARAYFTVVWLTHLANVALCFSVVRVVTGAPRIACVAAVLFGTCYALEGALGWYSVYGHVLVGTALLVILLDAARLQARGALPGRLRRVAWAVLALAGSMTFGVGVAIALALPFALAVLFPALVRRRIVPPLWPLIPAVPIAYVGLFWLYGLIGAARQIQQVQRLTHDLLDQALAVPRFTLELIAYGIDRMLTGPLPVPPYPAPVGAALTVAAVALVTAAALRAGTRWRRWMAAAALLTAATYGVIGAGRVVLLEYMSRAEAIAQPRYHYVGVLGLVLIAAAALATTTRSPAAIRIGRRAFPAWLAVWAIGFWLWPAPIEPNFEERKEVAFLISWMRGQAQQIPPGEDLYLPNRAVKAAGPLFFTRQEFPGWAGLFSIYFPDPTIEGHRVFFIEHDPAVRAAHRDSRRLVDVLVAPELVPAPPPRQPSAISAPPRPAERPPAQPAAD